MITFLQSLWDQVHFSVMDRLKEEAKLCFHGHQSQGDGRTGLWRESSSSMFLVKQSETTPIPYRVEREIANI